jgi:hypothetical protein
VAPPAGALQIGPLVTAGFPAPIGLELIARTPSYGLGLEYGRVPQGLGDALLSIFHVHDSHLYADALSLDGRWFPFAGSFFVGSSLGRETLTATTVYKGEQRRADLSHLFLTPRAGWLVTLPSGFTLGADFGLQVPFLASATYTPPSVAGSTAARAAADVLAATPLPSIHLRLGYLL